MTTKELIAEAEKRYPAGNMVCNIVTGAKFISSGKFEKGSGGCIVTKKTSGYPHEGFIVYDQDCGWTELHPDQVRTNSHESQLKHIRNIIYND